MAIRTSTVVAATLTLDAAFFALNFYVFSLGGSKAVLSQAVAGATDLIGSLMIMWGQRAASLPASSKHPFGRGKERFFWAYSAGLVTFSLAGSLVFIEGFLQVLNPHSITDLGLGLLTVGMTFAANLGGFLIVLVELRQNHQTVDDLLQSSYVGVKMIFLQDIVSIAGASVALAGLALDRYTGLGIFDGVAAAVVGGLLLITGFAIGGDAREFLVGRAISEEESTAILSLVERYPYVRHVLDVRSMVLGPEDHLIVLRVNFLDEMDTDDVEMHVDQLRTFVCGEFPDIKHLIIEPVRAAGEEWDPETGRSASPLGSAGGGLPSPGGKVRSPQGGARGASEEASAK